MAQTVRESTPQVEQWIQQSLMLIEAASSYAEAGVYDAATDGMIRRMRVISTAMQGALNSIQVMASPRPPQ
jgi:uncharacterized protein with FMN-binding domain